MKRALITGITGMDGSHMADLLLSKGYEVYGLERHKSVPNRKNIHHIEDKIHFIKGDLSDLGSLISAVSEIRPDELYNFASQSFVGDSWRLPEYTCDITGMGVLRLLEAVRTTSPTTRVQQASSSEMFGAKGSTLANESTPFHPRSPYAVAKVFGHLTAQNFRESYGLFVSSSICFNHESERRGFEFVTRKISSAVARIHYGLQTHINLGTLDSSRDWGYAPEYCEGMWRMLQQDTPDDYIFATGTTHTVREFLDAAFKVIGITDWAPYVRFDKAQTRLAEVPYLLGDASKAKRILGWEARTTFDQLVEIMVNADLELLKKDIAE